MVLARGALGEREGVWIAGGAVRDAALGREVVDLDLAVAGDPGTGRQGDRPGGGGEHAFELSAEFATWRVVAADAQLADRRHRAARRRRSRPTWRERDFTIGAIAVPLAAVSRSTRLAASPTSSAACCGPWASAASPPIRCACCAPPASPPSLELEIDSGDGGSGAGRSARAGEPAGERQLVELRKLVGGPDPLRGMQLLDELGLTAVVLPELEALHGVEQGPNHHLDVHGHTMAVLAHALEVERDLDRFGGERGDEAAGAARRAPGRRDEPRHGAALRRPPSRHRQAGDAL